MITKKHLIVFLAFREVDVIKKSFESIEDVSSDIFVIENKSENSLEIEEYFKSKSKSLIGYIQFNENTENSSIPLFNKAFKDLVISYEYITYTDGDLYSYDAEEMFREILEAFKNPRVMVSSSAVWGGNYSFINSKEYIDIIKKNKSNLKPLELRKGFEDFLSEQKDNNRDFGSKNYPVSLSTGHFFVTLRNQDLNHIFDLEVYMDAYIYRKVTELKKEWHITNRNISYHMSWDLYYKGSPYYEWKRENKDTIWQFAKESDFRVIV
jgi:hypothetical protein